MNKYIFTVTTIITLVAWLANTPPITAQTARHPAGSTYRDRLVDYADIYNYELDTNKKDTLVYIRKINDYWYGAYGTANLGLSFGNFKGMIDPNNAHNIFNTIVNFYSKFGQGYTLGLMAEWLPANTDWGAGIKLGAFDKKITSVGSEDVKIINFFEGDYDFSANITYFTIAPYAKYTLPFLDGLFLTGGFDLSLAYSTVAIMERNYEYTGQIYHKIPIANTKANTRVLLSLGTGYDFFIADFFSKNNRVRVTPFAELKGGTNVISSGGSSWNDITLNVGIQFKLAPDIVKIDTLIYNPNNELQLEYLAGFDTEGNVEFTGFTRPLAEPPSFELTVVQQPPPPDTQIIVAVNVPDTTGKTEIAARVPTNTTRPSTGRPATRAERERPFFANNDTVQIGGYASSSSTAVTASQRAELDQLAKFMKENPNVTVRLTGHTDNQGSIDQQNTRSTARATNMRQYLINQGIRGNRVYFNGVGSVYPRSTNDTPAGRRRNNRVAVILISR